MGETDRVIMPGVWVRYRYDATMRLQYGYVEHVYDDNLVAVSWYLRRDLSSAFLGWLTVPLVDLEVTP